MIRSVIDTPVLQEALAMDEPATVSAPLVQQPASARDQLRQQAVALAQRSPGRRAEVAASLGISERTLYRWIQQAG